MESDEEARKNMLRYRAGVASSLVRAEKRRESIVREGDPGSWLWQEVCKIIGLNATLEAIDVTLGVFCEPDT